MTPPLRTRIPKLSATAILGALLAVLPALLPAAPVLAQPDAQTVSTRTTLFLGFPASEDTSEGVLVVPGTVIPSLGQGISNQYVSLEEERSRTLTRLSQELSSTFRLDKVEVSFSESHPLGLDQPAELSPPTTDSTLRITVELLGFDRRTATYRVRFVDRNVVLADTRVAAARGRQTVIGGLDGDDAPYLFLVVEPAVSTPPLRVEDGITAPRRVRSVMPKYTEEARKERIQGLVVLQTVIGKDGRVHDVKVLKGLPKGLSESAVEAIRQWEFEPARNEDGQPVEVYYNLTINFTLDEKKEKEKEGGQAPVDPPTPEG